MTGEVLVVASDLRELQRTLPMAAVTGASSVDCLWLGKMQERPQEAIRKLFVTELQAGWLPEDLVETIQEKLDQDHYDTFIFPATKRMREVCPRLAVALRAGYVEGVIDIEKDDTGLVFNRFSYGGTAIQKIRIRTPLKIISVVHENTEPTKPGYNDETHITELTLKSSGYSKRLLSQKDEQRTEDILTADRIIAVGRGIRKKEDISLVQELATIMQAKIACSRPLVEDLKWYSVDHQVGLSGNTVKPKLYIGIGISGQIQHIVGMRESKVIVAINKDKTAPIFQYADYGVVGDLYQVVPEIVRQLRSP